MKSLPLEHFCLCGYAVSTSALISWTDYSNEYFNVGYQNKCQEHLQEPHCTAIKKPQFNLGWRAPLVPLLDCLSCCSVLFPQPLSPTSIFRISGCSVYWQVVFLKTHGICLPTKFYLYTLGIPKLGSGKNGFASSVLGPCLNQN